MKNVVWLSAFALGLGRAALLADSVTISDNDSYPIINLGPAGAYMGISQNNGT